MVVDTHTHVWGPSTAEHPWGNEELEALTADLPIGDTYAPDELAADMAGAGVSEAVVVEYPIYDGGDNWYTLGAVRNSDEFYGVVQFDATDPGAPDRLREFMAEPGVLGFRLPLPGPADDVHEEVVRHDALWDAAADTGALVQVFPTESDIARVRRLVASRPDLTYAVDHAGRLGADVSVDDPAYAAFDALSEYDGVSVKLSAVPFLSDEPFPYEDFHESVRWFLDRFGRERLWWGSDYPVGSTVVDEYADSLDWIDAVDALSAADRRWLTDRAVRRRLGL